MLMTGHKLRTSGFASNHSANCVTTIAQPIKIFQKLPHGLFFSEIQFSDLFLLHHWLHCFMSFRQKDTFPWLETKSKFAFLQVYFEAPSQTTCLVTATKHPTNNCFKFLLTEVVTQRRLHCAKICDDRDDWRHTLRDACRHDGPCDVVRRRQQHNDANANAYQWCDRQVRHQRALRRGDLGPI